MLKRLSLIGAFFILSAPSYAQTATKNTEQPAKDGPAFSLTNADTVFDFVEIEEGALVKHEFLFTNTGSQPLIISNIHTDVPNAKFRWPSRFIKPGKTGIITVIYRSFMDVGPVAGDIYVSSNATTQPAAYLHIKGTVRTFDEDSDKPCCKRSAAK